MVRLQINDYTFYKITNINGDCELGYVGSTSNMKQRRRAHKSDCYNPNSPRYHLKLYETIRQHNGFDEFKFIELGYAKQISLNDARIIEEHYRQNLMSNLNTNRCMLTREVRLETARHEYHLDKGEKKRLYYQANKDRIKTYNRNRYHKLKEQVQDINI